MSSVKNAKKQNRKASKQATKLKQSEEDKKLFDELDATIEQNKKVEEVTQSSEPNDDPTEVKFVEQQTKTADDLIKIADSMYKQLKELAKTDDAFMKLDDKKKLDLFREKLNYKEFMTEFPIVSRYMVCMGQYSSKAFRRFLEKIRLTVHPPPDKREKGYMEDQWVRRQADYIRYLWEAYQKGHYNTAEASYVWEDAYKKLKGEFDDFKNKYKAVEESTKEEKEKFKAQNTLDLLDRLKTGEQQLNEEDAKALMELLKDKVYKRRFSNTMAAILQKAKVVPAVCEGRGTGPEEEVIDPSRPRVRMIEHLENPSRIGEVPDHMLLDQKTKDSLPSIKEDENESA